MDEYHLLRIRFGNKENAAGEEGWQRKKKCRPSEKFCSKIFNSQPNKISNITNSSQAGERLIISTFALSQDHVCWWDTKRKKNLWRLLHVEALLKDHHIYIFENRPTDWLSIMTSFGKGSTKNFGKVLSWCYDFRKSELRICGATFPNVSVQEGFAFSK